MEEIAYTWYLKHTKAGNFIQSQLLGHLLAGHPPLNAEMDLFLPENAVDLIRGSYKGHASSPHLENV